VILKASKTATPGKTSHFTITIIITSKKKNNADVTFTLTVNDTNINDSNTIDENSLKLLENYGYQRMHHATHFRITQLLQK